jgi:hypothetical protein
MSNAHEDSRTMPTPLVRLRMFRQNLKDMINGSGGSPTDGSSTPPALPPSSSDVSSNSSPHYSPSFTKSSAPLSSHQRLDESLFNETHQEENLHSFSRLKHLNTRVSSIKEELSRIVNSQQAFEHPSSAAATNKTVDVEDRLMTMEDMKLRLS